MEITLRFDGACSNNGLPNARGTYGWQAFDANNKLVGEGYGDCDGRFGHTCNVAEYDGLIAGLQWLQCLCPRVSELVIEGDSQLVIQTVIGNWRCKKEHIGRLRDEAQQLLSRLDCTWSAEWIPREHNTDCDALTRN